MSTGKGITSKAAFRLNKPDLNVDLSPVTNGAVVTVYPTSPSVAAAGAQRMGLYDQIPFLSESVNETYEFQEQRTLEGQAGISGHDVVSKLGAGPIDMDFHYLGMDNILAATLGFEKPSYNDSPTFDESQSAGNPMTGTTTAGTTSTTLEDTGASQFVSDNIGEFVRIADEGDGAEGQVRRITANPDTDNLTVTPAWITNPGAGKTYQIARAFTHTYECSKLFGVNTFASHYSNYAAETSGNANDVMLHFGTLVFDKNVSIWEWRGVMVNSLTLTYSAKESLKASAELVPFDLDLASSINTASTNWKYMTGPTTPIHLQERVMPADLTFRVGDWSSGTALDSGDNICISDFTLNINNNFDVETQTTCSGLYRAEPLRNGFREITGTFTVPRYTADTFITAYNNDTMQMASAVFEGSTLTGSNVASKNTLKIWIRAMKITGYSVPVQGENIIVQTFNFKAFIPTSASAGMPSVTNSNSEIVVQTINNNPFNAFRAQNGE